MRIFLRTSVCLSILVLAWAHPLGYAADNNFGQLFDVGTDSKKPARTAPAPSGKNVGDLFGVEPTRRPAGSGKSTTRDVVGNALTEHDQALLSQATGKLDQANARMSKHCGCVLAGNSRCDTPWRAERWERSSSFLRREERHEQTLAQVCRDWQPLSATAPRATIEEANESAQKVARLAGQLDEDLAQTRSAARSDRRRYENEQREAREREERRQARAREREREARREAREREREAREERERRNARNASSDSVASPNNYWANLGQKPDPVAEIFRRNNEMMRNAVREQAASRERERAEAQRRQAEAAQRRAQYQRQQQHAQASASRAREQQRLAQEREAQRRDAQRRAEQERQRQAEARRQAEQERQRQAEARRQAREAQERQRVAQRQAEQAAKERARQDYLHAMKNNIRAKAISCFGETHVVASRPRIQPKAVSCIDVHWRAYCPGTRGVFDVTHNVVGMGTGCYGDTAKIQPKPACPIDQVLVEVRDVRACP